MKKLYILIGALFFLTACDNELDQSPPNIASADSLTDFDGVLNAAYFYNRGSVTPMAVMGDFRADNAFMDESPFTEFDVFTPDLTMMEDQFFGPFYTQMYRCILSANTVIENSTNTTQIGEARFLRALAYFKLARVFGDATINLDDSPSPSDQSILVRSPFADVYALIISDLEEAIRDLDTEIVDGRASQFAAQGMLGKVFMQLGQFSNAEPHLAAVVNGAAGAGISLQDNFADIFGMVNDLNSEIIFAAQISSSINDEYGFSEFWSWSGGLDTKSLLPLDMDLVEAFDAVAGEIADPAVGDLRRAVTIDTDVMASPKFPQTDGPEHDWIELRLADVILLYAEALNETGAGAGTVLGLLDPIRTRAGLNPIDPAVVSSQGEIRQAIQDERRLELAFEGQRWFDLVRTGTVNAEMGVTVPTDFLLFPVPNSEVLAFPDVIFQNPGY